jgi:hypothetical protein
VSGKTGGDARVHEDDLKKLNTEVWRDRPLLRLSEYPHNKPASSQFPLQLLLLFPVIFLRHPDASFSQSKPLSQLPNRHGPFLRLNLRLLSFFKGVLFQNFNSVVERELLVMGVQRLEDIFSIVSTNLSWV